MSDLWFFIAVIIAAYAFLARSEDSFKYIKWVTSRVPKGVIIAFSLIAMAFFVNEHHANAICEAIALLILFTVVYVTLAVSGKDERAAELKEERFQGHCDGYLSAVQTARMIEDNKMEDEAEALRLRVLFNSHPFEIIAEGNELISQRISGECEN